MKINISIESNPAELAELLKVTQGERDVVQEALDYLEKEISNRATCHIPADHIETGTVIQGKPPREPEVADIQLDDLVKCRWPNENFAPQDEEYRVIAIDPYGTAFIQPMSNERSFPLYAQVKWLSRVEPEPTPFRPMRDPSTRIQTGDHVIVQPFTGYNEIFTVPAANNGRALLLGEIGEEEIQELSNLLPVWPDSEGNYCFHRNDAAAELPKE